MIAKKAKNKKKRTLWQVVSASVGIIGCELQAGCLDRMHYKDLVHYIYILDIIFLLFIFIYCLDRMHYKDVVHYIHIF